MLVIEGPDGAGKTTLVNQLLERFPVLKLGERSGENSDRAAYVLEDTLHAMSRAVRHTANIYVYDRLWPSELVYSQVFERKCSLSHDQIELLVRLDGAARWPLVVCLPPLEVVKESMMDSPQMEGVVDKIEDIYKLYHDLAVAHGYFMYNWTRPGRHTMLMGYVEEYLFVRSERGPRGPE